MKNKTKNKLPKKASDLLLVSLADLEMVENNPKYKIDMGTWHSNYGGEVCSVCHAGAVMAGTIGVSINHSLGLLSFDHKVKMALKSLDHFRIGDAEAFNGNNGFMIRNTGSDGKPSRTNLHFPEADDYSTVPVGSEEWQIYKDWIVDYAMFLKSEGY